MRWIVSTVVALGLVLGGSVGRAEDRALSMYAWLGAEAAGRLGTAEFDRFFRAAVKIRATTIATRPSKAEILAAFKQADVIYTNSHSGYPKKGPPRMVLETAAGGGEDGELSAEELRAALAGAPGPTLVIVDGCNTLARPSGDVPVLALHEALGITAKTRGRAYVGFEEAIIGVRGDEFFRIFFAIWTRTPYPSLEVARREAVAFLEAKHPGKQPFLDPRAAEIGKKLLIMGDAKLTWKQLLAKGAP